MNIIETLEGKTLTIALEGELNTMTAPQLEKVVSQPLDHIDTLVLDFTNLVYLSSAGLRVLLIAKKALGHGKKMIVKNVCEEVMEVFEITGFADILDFE